MSRKRVVLGGNLFWGMQFRTCKNFWDFADPKSSLNPKNSYKYKSHTAITSIVSYRIIHTIRGIAARFVADSCNESKSK